MPDELRLFLALWPPPDVLPLLVANAEAWEWNAEAKRTRPERLHITLHFIGNVPAQRLPELGTGLDAVWTGGELELDAATVWRGGIAVLEARRVPPVLMALHDALGERLRALDLPVEARPWRPHVTLARKAFGARPPAFAPLGWRAGPAYALVRTMGGGRGYETLQAFG